MVIGIVQKNPYRDLIRDKAFDINNFDYAGERLEPETCTDLIIYLQESYSPIVGLDFLKKHCGTGEFKSGNPIQCRQCEYLKSEILLCRYMEVLMLKGYDCVDFYMIENDGGVDSYLAHALRRRTTGLLGKLLPLKKIEDENIWASAFLWYEFIEDPNTVAEAVELLSEYNSWTNNFKCRDPRPYLMANEWLKKKEASLTKTDKMIKPLKLFSDNDALYRAIMRRLYFAMLILAKKKEHFELVYDMREFKPKLSPAFQLFETWIVNNSHRLIAPGYVHSLFLKHY